MSHEAPTRVNATLYLESTIPSYLAARPSRDLIVAAHQQITHEWWQEARSDFDIYISQIVLDEISAVIPTRHSRRFAIRTGMFKALPQGGTALSIFICRRLRLYSAPLKNS